jgi:TRAP-type C4-dicarboxylate transport system permease large subunit
LLVGGVLLILGVALGFTHYLVDAQLPDRMVQWATATVQSKWLFLLGMNIVLLFVGGLVEIYAAIVVVVPLLVPLGVAFGADGKALVVTTSDFEIFRPRDSSSMSASNGSGNLTVSVFMR